MTSFIAACGSGRSTSVIPAVPAAWSVTTIAFIVHLPVCGRSSSSEFLCRRDENRKAKLDRLMTVGYWIDAIDAARKNRRCGTNICFSRRKGALVDGG